MRCEPMVPGSGFRVPGGDRANPSVIPSVARDPGERVARRRCFVSPDPPDPSFPLGVTSGNAPLTTHNSQLTTGGGESNA